MKAVIERAKGFLKSEEGPTSVEYAVMLALIIVACIATIELVGQHADSTFQTVDAALS